jgi:hypothetical protein
MKSQLCVCADDTVSAVTGYFKAMFTQTLIKLSTGEKHSAEQYSKPE